MGQKMGSISNRVFIWLWIVIRKTRFSSFCTLGKALRILRIFRPKYLYFLQNNSKIEFFDDNFRKIMMICENLTIDSYIFIKKSGKNSKIEFLEQNNPLKPRMRWRYDEKNRNSNKNNTQISLFSVKNSKIEFLGMVATWNSLNMKMSFKNFIIEISTIFSWIWAKYLKKIIACTKNRPYFGKWMIRASDFLGKTDLR